MKTKKEFINRVKEVVSQYESGLITEDEAVNAVMWESLTRAQELQQAEAQEAELRG